jgi:hypothetical protein
MLVVYGGGIWSFLMETHANFTYMFYLRGVPYPAIDHTIPRTYTHSGCEIFYGNFFFENFRSGKVIFVPVE